MDQKTLGLIPSAQHCFFSSRAHYTKQYQYNVSNVRDISHVLYKLINKYNASNEQYNIYQYKHVLIRMFSGHTM